MGILIRLVARSIEMLLRFSFSATLEILGFLVRLLYWSVRTYGWGRVGSFFFAFWLSLEIHKSFGRPSFSSATLGSIAISTLIIWGMLLGVYFWLSYRWQQRSSSQNQNSSPSTSLNKGFSNLNAFSSFTSSLVNFNSEKSNSLPSSGDGMSLWEKVLHPTNLQEAWRRVLLRCGSPGSDGVTVEQFALEIDRNLKNLADELLRGRYRPRQPRWIEVPKSNGKMRRLSILCVRDRIVQQALLLVLAPLWDKHFAPCSYAYRHGKSAHQAVKAVEEALSAGRVWVLDADIESFFDSVPHENLFSLLNEWLPDERVRSWLQICVSGVSPLSNKGLAQGAPLSPLLANLYLHRFDITLLQANYRLIRYADDFVVLCPTREQAEEALRMSERLLKGLGLSLNAEKTRIVHRDDGFTFLGYVFTRDGKRPSEEAILSLNSRLSATNDETKRRQILAGWQGYFGKVPNLNLSANTTYSPSSKEVIEETDWLEPWWSDLNEEPRSDSEVNLGNLTLYRQRFLGRTDIFARYWQKDGRRGYAPIRREINDDDLKRHLSGQDILGTYLLSPDGTTKALVLDIDGPNFSEAGRALAFSLTQKMFNALKQQGIKPLWEYSGGKGFHLWLCFERAVSAFEVRRKFKQWLEQFRPFPEGVLVEIFPKQDFIAPNALGSLLRLPLGCHPETGRFSQFLEEDGSPSEDPWSLIASVPLIDPTRFLEKTPCQWQENDSALPEPPESIAPMVKGCALIWGLVQKARKIHHLRHIERLALLYTLGHCGEEGHNYLHQVISLCSNYNPRITERWLQRLDTGHNPIRCATLKEWLKDLLPGVNCSCMPQKRDPTPLDILRKVPKEASNPHSHQPEKGLWEELAEEIFGDMLDLDTEDNFSS